MADSTSKPPEIAPLEGWEPVGPYGLQRFKEGSDGRLLRLDEALYWMAHTQEWPRKKAVYEAFSPLVQWDEADGKYRRQVLYMLNGEEYAYPISLGDRLNPRAVDVWGDLPFSYQDGYSQGTVREIADLWDESWPGYVQDPDDFYRNGWVSYCKAMKALAIAAEGQYRWEKAYRERYFMSLGEWKDRSKRAVRSLSRLAVPFDVAHELWGWGAVAVPAAVVLSLVPASVPTAVALPVPSAAPAKRIAQKDQAPEWTGQRLSELRKTLKGDAPTQQMVAETRLPEREIRRREKEWRDSRRNPIAANAFTAVKPTGTGGRGVKR
ncbi:MAG: hypothetical protein PHT57_14650 [Rhodoferax sp.]|nr:hypothetical protein [Rhodoferax sp.]